MFKPAPRCRLRHVCVLVALLALMLSEPAGAQQSMAVEADFLFYGDNTEFSNQFRGGDTLLGTAGRIDLDVGISERVDFRIGVFGNQRFGSSAAFELVRPVFSLSVKAGRSQFVFGTLESGRRRQGIGPDRGGPHGLIPPLQRETLSFTRPYEAGLQWIHSGRSQKHEVWLNWQKLNRPTQRELFDTGGSSELSLSKPLSLSFQWHIVHHGGQRYGVGAVSDSYGLGPGLILAGNWCGLDKVSLEVHGLFARDVPNREELRRRTTGAGIFTRAAGERRGWRGHIIVWRANDFIKEEGDPNYLSLRENGRRFRRVRDYAEAGLTRSYRPADEVEVEGSVRLHRVESHYEYSYRILGIVRLRWPWK